MSRPLKIRSVILLRLTLANDWRFGVLGVLGDGLFVLPGGLPLGRFPLSSRAALGVNFAFAGTFFFVLFFALDFISFIRLSLNVKEGGSPLFLPGLSFPMFTLSY